MDLDTFIITVFCWIDEAIPRVTGGGRLRERGPAPTLTDSEVLTMEVVGEYLGLVQDSAQFAYFRQHYAHVFPLLPSARSGASDDLCPPSRQPVTTLAAHRTAVAGCAAARAA